MTKTQIFEFDLLGQHAGCGGNVFLYHFINGGKRRCTMCGANGINATLSSEAEAQPQDRLATLVDLTVVA